MSLVTPTSMIFFAGRGVDVLVAAFSGRRTPCVEKKENVRARARIL